MVELDGDISDDGDDIARFERQCAARARAEGLLAEDEEQLFSENEEEPPALVAAAQATPKSGEEWRQRCLQLEAKLGQREGRNRALRQDLELLRAETAANGQDPASEMKQRLLELTKKNRRLQVTVESQRSKLSQMEVELKRPRQAQDPKAAEAALGEGAEDWKKKYLAAGNKLQELRHEVLDLRSSLNRQKKVLLRELGSDEALEKALAAVDDPNAAPWKGRAEKISSLQRQVKELREQLRSEAPDSEVLKPPEEKAAERERKVLEKAAEKRREEFDRLQEEVDRLRSEAVEAKRKRDALKGRSGVLEGQLRELKGSVQELLRKSDNDNALVDALRRQLARQRAEVPQSRVYNSEEEALRQENAELQAQLERQAQIVVQLRQKQFAGACDSGGTRLGPTASASDQQVLDRVRFLEAENARQQEQVRLLEARLGDAAWEAGGRPASADSSGFLKDKLRFASAEREPSGARQRPPLEPRGSELDSSPSCASRTSMVSRSSSRGIAPPPTMGLA